jgi:hypothetical protein
MSIPVITQIEWHAEVEVRFPDVEYHVDERNEDVIVATVQGDEVGRYVGVLGAFYAWVRATEIDSTETIMNDRIEWN